MKIALLSTFCVASLTLCCGIPCCGGGSSNSWKDQVIDKVQDKVAEKVAEKAIEEGVEYALEQAYGDGTTVELELEDRHFTIKKEGRTRADLWGMPDALPKGSKLPTPPEVTYVYVVQAETESTLDGAKEQHMIYGEAAGLEYAEKDQEKVAQAFTEWAEKENFKVTRPFALPEDALLPIPGLEHVGAKQEDPHAKGTHYIVIESENRKGILMLGPARGQLWYEDANPEQHSPFFWNP